MNHYFITGQRVPVEGDQPPNPGMPPRCISRKDFAATYYGGTLVSSLPNHLLPLSYASQVAKFLLKHVGHRMLRNVGPFGRASASPSPSRADAQLRIMAPDGGSASGSTSPMARHLRASPELGTGSLGLLDTPTRTASFGP